MVHDLAGKPAPRSMLVDVPRLLEAYARDKPDMSVAAHRVAFGTSGHRGGALRRSFNDAHIAAIAQAIVEHRARIGVDGPLFLGVDTHALSAPAARTAIEVLAAHGVHVRIAAGGAYTPTPVVSHAILAYNRGRTEHLADGIVVTPSHNPPDDGGIKYDPPDGGPADTTHTTAIENRANEILRAGTEIRRVTLEAAMRGEYVREHDFIGPYVDDLAHVVDFAAIRGVALGADPLGGASISVWDRLVERHGLNLTITDRTVDPTFGFMPVDHDGKIRMDCSSPYAMANLVRMKDRFALAFGNDADADRHGIVTPTAGLMNPNHVLAVAIDYVFTHRKWVPTTAIGKTLVSSSMIDRVAAKIGRRVVEVPVGFKWFVGGLLDGSLGFAGEESAGACLLRQDGTTWTTDKDGIVMDLVMAEIVGATGKTPSDRYDELAKELGRPLYTRVDRPITAEAKAALKTLSPDKISVKTLAGQPIQAILTKAPGNGADIGGIKVVAADGWFAARPSGTEDVSKVYAESFRDDAHLAQILDEAMRIVSASA